MIHYLTGDATRPVGDGNKLIVHICNDLGGWGSGFVLALSKKWPYPERAYRRWHLVNQDVIWGRFQLGAIQVVPVQPDICVVNMVAQRGYNDTTSPRAVQYDALEMCLREVALLNSDPNKSASVHCPRIGCGLGGGSWSEIEPILRRTLLGIEVFVYDLP